MRVGTVDLEEAVTYPIRGIFVGCCAWTQKAGSKEQRAIAAEAIADFDLH